MSLKKGEFNTSSTISFFKRKRRSKTLNRHFCSNCKCALTGNGFIFVLQVVSDHIAIDSFQKEIADNHEIASCVIGSAS